MSFLSRAPARGLPEHQTAQARRLKTVNSGCIRVIVRKVLGYSSAKGWMPCKLPEKPSSWSRSDTSWGYVLTWDARGLGSASVLGGAEEGGTCHLSAVCKRRAALEQSCADVLTVKQ